MSVRNSTSGSPAAAIPTLRRSPSFHGFDSLVGSDGDDSACQSGDYDTHSRMMLVSSVDHARAQKRALWHLHDSAPSSVSSSLSSTSSSSSSLSLVPTGMTILKYATSSAPMPVPAPNPRKRCDISAIHEIQQPIAKTRSYPPSPTQVKRSDTPIPISTPAVPYSSTPLLFSPAKRCPLFTCQSAKHITPYHPAASPALPAYYSNSCSTVSSPTLRSSTGSDVITLSTPIVPQKSSSHPK